AAHGYDLFLEIGPTPVLSNLGKRCLPDTSATWLTSLRQDYDDWQVLLQSIASLYCEGYNLDWSGFGGEGRKITLPAYPFEREYCWFKSEKSNEGARGGKSNTVQINSNERTAAVGVVQTCGSRQAGYSADPVPIASLVDPLGFEVYTSLVERRQESISF